jgi:hypothetical protein
MTGMEEGLFPIGESDFSQEELEEERRLCYVGMTRAKQFLYLTWAATRRLFGHSRWNAPSRFIEEAGLATPSKPSLPSPTTHGTSEVRERLPDSEPAEDYFHQAQQVDFDAGIVYSVGMRVRHPEFGDGKIIEKINEPLLLYRVHSGSVTSTYLKKSAFAKKNEFYKLFLSQNKNLMLREAAHMHSRSNRLFTNSSVCSQL